MATYSLSHLSDHVLLRDLSALVARDRTTTAELLAHIAEVDERRVYAPAGYPSMHAYCVDELHLSEDAAFKRIQAARAAREFPGLLPAVADGRLHLTAVNLLAPHLTAGNVDALINLAAHQRKLTIEQRLAQRFPRSETLAMVETVPAAAPSASTQLAPAQVGTQPTDSAEPAALFAPAQVASSTSPPRVAPVAAERFLLSVTIAKSTHDNLRYAQALLSHAIPSGDVAQVLDRALEALVKKLEKRRFSATGKPRRSRLTASVRTVPAHVRRTVWKRDGGQCTFVGENGHRCGERRFLQFDHIQPVARGGQATVEGMRLRCRAHNQLEAERIYGVTFMRHKRQEALEARAARTDAAKAAQEAQKEVIPWLRALGFRADEARRAAERCGAIPDAPLEERVRLALTSVRA